MREMGESVRSPDLYLDFGDGNEWRREGGKEICKTKKGKREGGRGS